MTKTLLISVLLLCSYTSAFAGMSHRAFKNAPAQVFAAAVAVANHGHNVVIDSKQQTVAFSTGTPGAYLGVNRLTVFLAGLPDGCADASPCTGTELKVKCERVTPDTMGFRLCNGDVNSFFGRLKHELKKMSGNSPSKPESASDPFQ